MKRKLLQLAGFLVALYAATFYLAPWFFPLPEDLTDQPVGLVYVDQDGEPFRRLLADGKRTDTPATFDEFPSTLVYATLAAEDSRFFSHNGIDFPRIVKAASDALTHRQFVSGASTITQQTIKLYSPARDRDFRTKLIEIFTARHLEMTASKEEILTAYLNRLPYGNQFTGSRAAARGYFGKPLGDLSVAEAALLAGLPNKPTRYNPWRNLDGAKRRQLWILDRMKEERYLTEAQFTAALIEPVRILPGLKSSFRAPHFVELANRFHPAVISKAKRNREPIATTLDLALQDIVERISESELSRLSGEDDDLQTAVVVIENQSGHVLALSGSRSFFGSESGQINGAWRPRSAGSTLKPFTYLSGLEKGKTAASLLDDTAVEYATATGSYAPVNFDRRFHGDITLRHALANSMNVPAVKLLDEIGGPRVLHTLLADDLGFTSLAENPSEYGLGLTLGNAEVSLLELTNAYATLARLGVHKPITFLRSVGFQPSPPEQKERWLEADATLNRVKSSTQPCLVPANRIFDHDQSWLIADILSDSRARVAAFGLNSALDLPFRVAAKTGTSTDFRDSWTIGYTPDHTVGVWVGRFSNRPLDKISGAMGAAPIFNRVMTELYSGHEPRWYPLPASADKIAGEWFVNGTKPERKIETVTQAEPLQILSPVENTIAFLDPDLPGGGARFPLRANLPGIEWQSESLRIEGQGSARWLHLAPGDHKIIATNPSTGETTTSHFRVDRL